MKGDGDGSLLGLLLLTARLLHCLSAREGCIHRRGSSATAAAASASSAAGIRAAGHAAVRLAGCGLCGLEACEDAAAQRRRLLGRLLHAPLERGRRRVRPLELT